MAVLSTKTLGVLFLAMLLLASVAEARRWRNFKCPKPKGKFKKFFCRALTIVKNKWKKYIEYKRIELSSNSQKNSDKPCGTWGWTCMCGDVDECKEGLADCPDDTTCVNTRDGYECKDNVPTDSPQCIVSPDKAEDHNSGSGSGSGSHRSSSKNSHRPSPPPPQHVVECHVRADCVDGTCVCKDGFEGDGTANGSGCSDIDECADSPCTDPNCHCVNYEGYFECPCNAGFDFNPDGICEPNTPPEPVCGNGVLEGDEECDDFGLCCSSTCKYLGADIECRGAASVCDAPEMCTGVSSACPADSFAPAGTSCDNPTTACTVDTCDGTGVCTDGCTCGNGIVEPGEECDGGECCAADCTFAAAGTTCGAAPSGPCDVADTCSGTSATCTDAVADSTVVCRAAASECDVAETCDGVTASCPVDGFAAAGTTCGAAPSGPCDVADTCAGTSATCVANVADSSVVCRAAASECDVAETCDGVTASCPVDGFAAAGTPCGAAPSGSCDMPDTCAGTSATCVDNVADTSFVCRAAASTCDVAETCDGVSGACPADGFAPDNTACDLDADSCTADTCQAGVCTAGVSTCDPPTPPPPAGPCGNGIVDFGEECDPGKTLPNGDPHPDNACCNPDCTFAPIGTTCDDGFAHTSEDQCQQLFILTTSTFSLPSHEFAKPVVCTGLRQFGAQCGDGAVNVGEECDDGNLYEYDCCSASCTQHYLQPCSHNTRSTCEKTICAKYEFQSRQGCIPNDPMLYPDEPASAWDVATTSPLCPGASSAINSASSEDNTSFFSSSAGKGTAASLSVLIVVVAVVAVVIFARSRSSGSSDDAAPPALPVVPDAVATADPAVVIDANPAFNLADSSVAAVPAAEPAAVAAAVESGAIMTSNPLFGVVLSSGSSGSSDDVPQL